MQPWEIWTELCCYNCSPAECRARFLAPFSPGACPRRNCVSDFPPRWLRSALVCSIRRSFKNFPLASVPLNREGPSLQGLTEPGVRPLFRQLQSTQSSNLPCGEALRCVRRNHGMPHPLSRYSVREHPDFLPTVCRRVCDGGASWSGKALRARGKISREWTRMNGAGRGGQARLLRL